MWEVAMKTPVTLVLLAMLAFAKTSLAEGEKKARIVPTQLTPALTAIAGCSSGHGKCPSVRFASPTKIITTVVPDHEDKKD